MDSIISNAADQMSQDGKEPPSDKDEVTILIHPSVDFQPLDPPSAISSAFASITHISHRHTPALRIEPSTDQHIMFLAPI
jgi:hypothetical protein